MTAKLTEFELRSVMRPLLVVWGALLAMTVLLCAVLAVTGLNSYENMIHSGKVLNLISSSMPEEITGALLYESVKLMEPEREIIQCKDCKHCINDGYDEYTPYGFYNTYDDFFCDKHFGKDKGEHLSVNIDDYCSFAERKEDNKQE